MKINYFPFISAHTDKRFDYGSFTNVADPGSPDKITEMISEGNYLTEAMEKIYPNSCKNP